MIALNQYQIFVSIKTFFNCATPNKNRKFVCQCSSRELCYLFCNPLFVLIGLLDGSEQQQQLNVDGKKAAAATPMILYTLVRMTWE